MPPDIEGRISALEQRADRVDAKLDRMGEQLATLLVKVEQLPTRVEIGDLATSIASIKGRIEQHDFVRLSSDLASVRSKVESLPTWFQMFGLAGLISLLALGLGNADRIIRSWREPLAVSAPTLPPTPPPTKTE
jgi:hypothetical protein